MILDHFDEQPRNPHSEVAALRRLRSLEKKLTEVEKERLLDQISSQMDSDIPEEIRAEVIRGLRDVDNDRLIECETRPQEFTKYLFLEVVKRRVPKDGGDDDGLVNYEIVGGKVLALKSDRQKRSVDDLKSERDSLRIQEKAIYDRMRRLDHVSNEETEEKYFEGLRIQQEKCYDRARICAQCSGSHRVWRCHQQCDQPRVEGEQETAPPQDVTVLATREIKEDRMPELRSESAGDPSSESSHGSDGLMESVEEIQRRHSSRVSTPDGSDFSGRDGSEVGHFQPGSPPCSEGSMPDLEPYTVEVNEVHANSKTCLL